MRRHRHVALGLGVLVAHAGLYVGLAALLRQPPDRSPEIAAASMVRVHLPPVTTQALAPAAAATARAAPAGLHETRSRPSPAFDALRGASLATELSATHAPADHPLPAETRPLAPAPLPPPAASQAALPALNLALPRQPAGPPSAAALAAQDARWKPRPTRDEQLAQALGTDTRLQEIQRGEVRRIQHGRACVDVEPARESGLNPFNQSASPTPRQARPC